MSQLKTDEKLKAVLNFIVSFSNENGFPPSVREICAELGIKSTATTYYYLEKLKDMGLLKKTKSKNRALEVMGQKANYRSVPLVGRVTAGKPILAVENIEETLPLPASMFKSNDLFMLTVSGQSMVEAGIFDGDVIIVTRTNTAKNGDIVVALIGDEATVKRFYKRNDCFVLHPENRTMNDIIVKEVEILGVVDGLLRKY